MKVIVVAGARPNFMKIAPLMKEFSKHSEFEVILVHTGQHYDVAMNKQFFDDLEIPIPNYNLEVGSGSHSTQTANIMIKFEEVCLKEKPDLVCVVGDVNSTIAAALVAKKLNIKVAHVESGLRSFDDKMPEEINRVLTDRISDYLFVSEDNGLLNLKNEGFPDNKIFYVGNIMIDCLINNMEKIKLSTIKDNLKLENHCVLTLHRPSNVDTSKKLSEIIELLETIQLKLPIVWPLHPRTRNNLEKFNLMEKVKAMKNITITSPLGYHDFMNLVYNSCIVITDSGGIQEETTFLGIPCLTLRDNTERPSTINGTNVLIKDNYSQILPYITQAINKDFKKGKIPKFWDGKTAERIVQILKKT